MYSQIQHQLAKQSAQGSICSHAIAVIGAIVLTFLGAFQVFIAYFQIVTNPKKKKNTQKCFKFIVVLAVSVVPANQYLSFKLSSMANNWSECETSWLKCGTDVTEMCN